MTHRIVGIAIAGCTLAAASLFIGDPVYAADSDAAAHRSTTLGPYSIPEYVPPDYQEELNEVLQTLDRVERQTLAEARALPINAGTNLLQIRTLGKLLLYDKNLSVERNTPCTLCHTPETGFTGPVSALNATTVAYPGSVRYRFGSRKPKTYAYSAYAPIFHLDQGSKQFFGGIFWDQRATGWKLQNPAISQAMEPPVDALEMGFSDSACAVYRLTKAPYLFLFEDLWGNMIDSIQWPGNIDRICSTPTSGPADPELAGNVPLDPTSRSIEKAVYDQFAMSIVANEAGPEVSPFNSKFDYAIKHPEKRVLTAREMAGWQLFDGKGKCNLCHTDGMTAQQQGRAELSVDQVPEAEPLFTNFAAFNLGIPKNDDIPFLYEDKADQYGVNPNPQGPSTIDTGLAAFLGDNPGVGQINPNDRWKQYEQQSLGKFQTATIRDVDKRPSPEFVKSYFHNGFMKSLKEVVHFYNTRDVLPKCAKGDDDRRRVGKSCWPAPEVAQNLEQRIGNLGLTAEEEDEIVEFMETLTDGYFPVDLKQ